MRTVKHMMRLGRKGFVAAVLVAALSAGVARASVLPPNLGNLIVWLKPETLSQADGSQVTLWTDSSGNGHDAVAAAGWTNPTYNAAGFNSRPAVSFGASSTVDALFIVSAGNPTPPQFLALGSGFTIAVTFKTSDSRSSPGGSRPANTLIADRDAGTTSNYLGVTDGRGDFERYQNVAPAGWKQLAGTTQVDDNSLLPGHFLVATHNSSSGDANLYTDGALESSLNVVYNGSTGLNVIGNLNGPDRFIGLIGEILVYNTDLNSTDLAQLDTYLTQRWLEVPEPASFSVLGAGALLVLARRR